MPFTSWLRDLLRSGPQSTAAVHPARPAQASLPVQAPHAAASSLRGEGYDYPAIDPGISVRAVDALIEANAEMMTRIKLAYGCDAATFERDIVTVVRSYASYVNLLPATADNYFAEPGGLFRLGLEVGFYALQGTDAQIFEGRATITARRHLEPRWRLATFIAGLCSEVHRTLSHLSVRDEKGETWPPYLLPLTPWAEVHGADRVFPRWDPAPHESRASGVFALPLIVDRTMMQYLATDNAVVVPHMMASISGTALYREHNILDDLVRRATAAVIDHNLRADTDRYGKPALGAHLERYLVDAMRRLASSSQRWQPNVRTSPVWYARDGMYLVWPKAIEETLELLESEHLPGMPKVPDTLLEILLDAKVFEARDKARATWEITPPDSDVKYEAVRLTTPDVLLGSFNGNPVRLDCVLQSSTRHEDAARPAAGPAGTETRAVPRSTPAMAHAQDSGRAGAHGAAQGGQGALLPPTPGDGARGPSERERFALTPSLRLRRTISDPLGAIVDTLNDRAARCARTVNTGLFIPLTELLARHLDPVVVQRELAEAGMLAHGPDGTPSQSHEFDGAVVPGIVLLPRYVRGLKPSDFASATEDEGEPDAAA